MYYLIGLHNSHETIYSDGRKRHKTRLLGVEHWLLYIVPQMHFGIQYLPFLHFKGFFSGMSFEEAHQLFTLPLHILVD